MKTLSPDANEVPLEDSHLLISRTNNTSTKNHTFIQMASTTNSMESTTKMLLPHEIGSSGDGSLMGSSLNNYSNTQYYHHQGHFGSGGVGSLNGGSSGGFYNNFQSNGFGNSLIHQQQPTGGLMNNNHHHHQTTNLIHQQSFYGSTKCKSDEEQKRDNETVERITEDTESSDAATEIATIIEEEEEEAAQEDGPEIDIVIRNVVCAFSVRCHLSLKDIALNACNVEYKRENGMVTMKLRKPYTTATMWSSGKITCTGATSEDQARAAARRYARILQNLKFRVRFNNYRVVNVLGTCKMPWAIKIVQFSEKHKKHASYEPELHPGVTYSLAEPKSTLKIFSTGSMTVTARSVANVQAAIVHIYPLVYEFRKPLPVQPEATQVVEETFLDLIEESDGVDEELEDGSNDEEDGEPNRKRFKSVNPGIERNFKHSKRPPGKVSNDPLVDFIEVSDPEDVDESDSDL
ncbi:unnamed protein product [Diamesa serratosioi]